MTNKEKIQWLRTITNVPLFTNETDLEVLEILKEVFKENINEYDKIYQDELKRWLEK